MMTDLQIRDNTAGLERWHLRPRLGQKGAHRQRGLLDPGPQAVPVPRQRVPAWGAKLAKGREVAWGSGRNVPPVLIRKHGCQPKRTMRPNSQRA